MIHYRNGVTIERGDSWHKFDLELEAQDLADAAAERGFEFARLPVAVRFKFARALVTQLLVADLVTRQLVEHRDARAQLAQAQQDLDECTRRGREIEDLKEQV